MNHGSNHRVVLVSGPPGSGKTTLARPLAEALGFALLTKDDIKETLYASMNGVPGDVEFSRRIGSAAMEVLWALAPHCPTVVLEANFRTKSSYEREKVATLLATGSQIVEVYCRLPREEASRRFAERAREVRHHPAHALAEMPPERMMEYEEPFGMTPVIEVDTRTPIDIARLVEQLEVLWARKGTSLRHTHLE
jgi:predicted kinase